MDKIRMPNAIAELDGDEMTHVLWGMIKKELIEPFVELNTEYYDLSLPNRDRTEDAVTRQAADAIKRLKVGVKCATITPNFQRQEEYGLRQLWKSPNATVRAALDGTVFRAPILLSRIKPVVACWEKPVTIARHAYGDLYKAVEYRVPGAAKAELVVTDENGYTRVGDVFIKNSSRQTVEGIVFDGTFAAALGEDAPQVLIVHTHGSEAYTMPAGEEYVDTGSFRTADASVSVIRVGDELARVLSGYGLSVLHDRALYDDPEYNGAYYRAEDAIEAYMEKYPSIGFILDVHRDALEDKAGHQYKVVTREDPDCAQVSLVMGSSWEGWQENLKFAVAVQQHLTERYPTLMRPLTLRNSDYNEYFTPGSLLVEIGAAGNSLDEALKAVRVFGEGFAEVVTGK